MTAIEVVGLTKRYGDLVAADDVTFDVAEGEVFALVGPNGAGKTTTVEIIEGLRTADSGEVRVLARSPGDRALTREVGVMPQRGDLYPGIKTEEALRLFASFYDDAVDPTALLEEMDLERVRRSAYRSLSGGERRRLSLALALVGRPRLVFLDEPTSEMDIEAQRTTWARIGELRERGVTVMLTTHSLDEAERIADRIGIIARGRLIASGTLAELAGGMTPTMTFTTSTTIDADALGTAIGVEVAEVDGRYRVEGDDATPELISRLATWLAARGVLLRTLDAGPRSLVDVYLELVR